MVNSGSTQSFITVNTTMSTPLKRFTKSNFLSENIDDFINSALDEPKQLIEPPKGKKTQKRSQTESAHQDISVAARKYQTISKKKKEEIGSETSKEMRSKLLGVMEHQIDSRKEKNEYFLKGLSEVMEQLEADCNALKNNQQKLQHLSNALVKCMDQAKCAHEQKLKTLNEIYAAFQKQSEEIESGHRSEANKLAEELEEDIEKLQQKLVSEAKRSSWENLRKTICQAMQSDF